MFVQYIIKKVKLILEQWKKSLFLSRRAVLGSVGDNVKCVGQCQSVSNLVLLFISFFNILLINRTTSIFCRPFQAADRNTSGLAASCGFLESFCDEDCPGFLKSFLKFICDEVCAGFLKNLREIDLDRQFFRIWYIPLLNLRIFGC
ncbi:Hypothetical_protein [Hexamita inflata]|uniref:Hypothetical_protein n=1 Tax=Hexamita inflata TaxID=28002 RepID=A0AA86NLS3_9EUKA|nr:Hypothetical protein HINF_LOCUS9744 [Hexamita inflata]